MENYVQVFLFPSLILDLSPNKSIWTQQSNAVVICLHTERKHRLNKETMIYNQSIGQESDNTNHLFVDVSIDKSITRLYFSPFLSDPNLPQLLKFRLELAISFHFDLSSHNLCLKSQVGQLASRVAKSRCRLKLLVKCRVLKDYYRNPKRKEKKKG